jgi:hypothetical protein
MQKVTPQGILQGMHKKKKKRLGAGMGNVAEPQLATPNPYPMPS